MCHPPKSRRVTSRVMTMRMSSWRGSSAMRSRRRSTSSRGPSSTCMNCVSVQSSTPVRPSRALWQRARLSMASISSSPKASTRRLV
jgi:hypothetical protein